MRLTSKYFDREPTFEESLELLAQHPFDFLAHFQTTRIDDLALNIGNLPWWSEFQHRLVILIALICAASVRGKSSEERFRIDIYRHNVYLETIRYCHEVVKPLDPEIAEYLVSNVVSLFGLPFPDDASRDQVK